MTTKITTDPDGNETDEETDPTPSEDGSNDRVEEPVEETAEETADDAIDEPRGWRRRLLDVALVALVLALAVAAVLTWRTTEQREDEAAAGRAAVTAAEAQVLELTTLDQRRIDDQLATLRSHTTGEFRRQFEGILNTFATVVKEQKIQATGSIGGSGLERLDGRRATVLVASVAEVTNADSKKPVPRTYRIRVNLSLVDGDWLTSGMEFVA